MKKLGLTILFCVKLIAYSLFEIIIHMNINIIRYLPRSRPQNHITFITGEF